MPAPDPTEEPLEACLGSATDEEWLAAHKQLAAIVAGMHDFPDEELAFIWDPELDPQTLIDPTEVDHSPKGDPDGTA